MFQKLSNSEVLRVLQTVEVRTYRDGEDVIREGEKGEELFAVLSGDVRVGRIIHSRIQKFVPFVAILFPKTTIDP